MLYEEEFLALERAGIRYVVVGGIATVLHGYARMTIDLDLVVELTTESTQQVVKVLTGMGYVPRAPVNPAAFTDAGQREQWKQEKSMTVFSFCHPEDPRRAVDLFIDYPLPEARLMGSAKIVTIGEARVPVVGLDELIEMKREVGRPRDVDDVEHLEEIRRLSK